MHWKPYIGSGACACLSLWEGSSTSEKKPVGEECTALLLWGSSCSQGDTWHLLTLGAGLPHPWGWEPRAGYDPALVSHVGRWSVPDSWLQLLSTEMFTWKDAEFAGFQGESFWSTRNLCEIPPLCKTCFTFFGFSSLSSFPYIPAYDCSFESYKYFSPCSDS